VKLLDNNMFRLIQAATISRRVRSADTERFDALRVLETWVPYRDAGFELFVIDDSDWHGEPDEDAYINFDRSTKLFFRQSVYDAALNGDPSCQFTCAHELAHLELHAKIARSKLSREPHKKIAHRTNPKQEMEANVYAGALQIPFPALRKDSTTWELRLQYRVSQEVAQKALDQYNYLTRKGFSFEFRKV